jgi:hypothetical protein
MSRFGQDDVAVILADAQACALLSHISSHSVALVRLESVFPLHNTISLLIHTTIAMSHYGGNNDDAMSRTTSVSRRQGSTMSRNQSLVRIGGILRRCVLILILNVTDQEEHGSPRAQALRHLD